MKNKKILLSILFGLLFFVMMFLVLMDMTTRFDMMIYDMVISLRCDFLDNYFTMITKLGNTKVVVVVIVGVMLLLRNQYGLFLAVSGLDSTIMNYFVKICIRRDRPSGLRLITQGGYSFPSGHAMISICVYGYLMYYVFHHIKNKVLKYSVSFLLFVVILSIGVSRIYVGVHFASDVLAGYLLALCYLLLLFYVMERFYIKRG